MTLKHSLMVVSLLSIVGGLGHLSLTLNKATSCLGEIETTESAIALIQKCENETGVALASLEQDVRLDPYPLTPKKAGSIKATLQQTGGYFFFTYESLPSLTTILSLAVISLSFLGLWVSMKMKTEWRFG